jgi:hypothetical protein
MSDSIRLTQLIPLLTQGYVGKAPSYQQAHRACVEAKIPADWDSGRWTIRIANVPIIASHFRMQPKVPAPSPKARTKVTTAG